MVVEKLPEVSPPSGKVPARGLLALPISEVLQLWNGGEIRDSGSVLGVFRLRGKYSPKEGARRWTSCPGDLVTRPGWGPHQVAAWVRRGSPLAHLGAS